MERGGTLSRVNRALVVSIGLVTALGVLVAGTAVVDAQAGPQPIDDNATEVYTGEQVEGIQGILDVVHTDDGGVLAVRIGGPQGDDPRSTILRLDSTGAVVNEATVPGSLQTISRVGPDSYAAAGIRGDDALLARIGADGSVEWAETYGGEGRDVALDAVSAPDGDAYLLASTESFDVDTSDLLVLRVDEGGSVVWQKLVEHESWTAFPKGERLQDGSLVATIRTKRSMNKSVDGKQNVSVVRIEPDGSVSWRTVISSPREPQDKEEMFDVIPAHGDGVLITGSSNSGNERGRNFDPWVARVHPDGTVAWQQTYDTPVRVFINDATRVDGGYVLTGFMAPEGEGRTGVVMGVVQDGTEIGRSTYTPPGESTSAIAGVEWTTDGKLLVGGQSIEQNREQPISRTWIADVSTALPVQPAPTAWESQHGNAAGSGDGEDPGGESGSDGDGAGSTDGVAANVTAPDSANDLVLYGATVLAVVAMFVPYGLRRIGSQ